MIQGVDKDAVSSCWDTTYSSMSTLDLGCSRSTILQALRETLPWITGEPDNPPTQGSQGRKHDGVDTKTVSG